MLQISDRSGGTPNESIQTANALGKLVIGTSSTPSVPTEQSLWDGNPSSAPGSSSAASAFGNTLKLLPAVAQSASAADASSGTAQPPIGAWSPASPELTAFLDLARNAQTVAPSQEADQGDLGVP